MNYSKYIPLIIASIVLTTIVPTHGMVKSLFSRAAAAGALGGTLYAAYTHAPRMMPTPSKIVTHNFNIPLPADLKQTLDKHHRELARKPDVKLQLSWCEDWAIKTGGGRMQGAKISAAIINENNFTNLQLPVTYEYQAPDGKLYTIAMLHHESSHPKTLAETKQLWRFAKKAPWSDCHCGNFVKINENTIMLIDTKDEFIQNPTFMAQDPREQKRIMIEKLMQYLPNFTPEAEAYLQRKYNKYKKI